MEDSSLTAQAESLASKIKHYLITTMGITVDEANDEEFYRAFSLTLREEIMINWTATLHTVRSRHARVLYYLCMEYMPGRLLGSNVTNIHSTGLVLSVLKKLGRDFHHLCQMEPDPGLGNGGLGRLASCLLDSLATQQYPAMAYGLRYQYGIFDQEVWDGIQVERPDAWLLHENPWEFRRDMHAETVCFAGQAVQSVNKKGVEIYDLTDFEEVRALSYDMPIIGYKEAADFNVNTLRLWTTKESPRNFALQRFNAGLLDQAAENTSLTDVLYPNDNNEVGKRIRLKQEFLLASASVQDIVHTHLRHFPDMASFADKVRIQVNDTHPALVIAELIRLLTHDYDYTWESAWEAVKTCCSYTNHTVLRESLVLERKSIVEDPRGDLLRDRDFSGLDADVTLDGAPLAVAPVELQREHRVQRLLGTPRQAVLEPLQQGAHRAHRLLALGLHRYEAAPLQLARELLHQNRLAEAPRAREKDRLPHDELGEERLLLDEHLAAAREEIAELVALVRRNEPDVLARAKVRAVVEVLDHLERLPSALLLPPRRVIVGRRRRRWRRRRGERARHEAGREREARVARWVRAGREGRCRARRREDRRGGAAGAGAGARDADEGARRGRAARARAALERGDGGGGGGGGEGGRELPEGRRRAADGVEHGGGRGTQVPEGVGPGGEGRETRPRSRSASRTVIPRDARS